jgi:hypothetical protein
MPRTRSAAGLPTPFESALRESNPPRRVGSPGPLPLGQGHVCHSSRRKPWDSSPQTSLARHLLSRQAPHRPDDFRWLSCGGRIRTCMRLLNRELPYRWATPHCHSVRTVGFEPTISCARGTRIPRLSHVLPFHCSAIEGGCRAPSGS